MVCCFFFLANRETGAPGMCRCVLRWVISPLYFFRFFYASGRNVRYSPPPILSAVSPASRLAKRGRAHLSGFAQEPQLVRNNNICHGALWAFGNKASIETPPPNEPAQQSLLSDLYLSESGGRKQPFQHIPLHLLARRLFGRSPAHLLECLGSENIGIFFFWSAETINK